MKGGRIGCGEDGPLGLVSHFMGFKVFSLPRDESPNWHQVSQMRYALPPSGTQTALPNIHTEIEKSQGGFEPPRH